MNDEQFINNANVNNQQFAFKNGNSGVNNEGAISVRSLSSVDTKVIDRVIVKEEKRRG